MPHNSHQATDSPIKERDVKSNITSIFISIKPHLGGAFLPNKQLNSSMIPNHLTKKDILTNKQGTNLKNDKGKGPTNNRETGPTNNIQQGDSLTINREEITQGNIGNWLNNRENKHSQPSIDKKRLTPQEVLDINTANKMNLNF